MNVSLSLFFDQNRRPLPDWVFPALSIFVCTLFMLSCFFAPQPTNAQIDPETPTTRLFGKSAAPPAAKAAEALNALDWLIGNWRFSFALETIRWRVEPASGGNFLVVQEELTVKNTGARYAVVRIVSWNPVSELFDWTIFGSDGSVGHGQMENIGEEWMLSTRILLPDAEPAIMTELFRPLQTGGFSWRSISRAIADAPLPDLGPIDAERIAPFTIEKPLLNTPLPAVLQADE